MIFFTEAQLQELGVVDYGYTTLETPLSINQYNSWVEKSNHQPLTYLEGDRQLKRENLKAYWSEFKSAVVFLFSYHEAHCELQKTYQKDSDWNGLKLASYTLGFAGEDYHQVLRERLIQIGEKIKNESSFGNNLEYKLTLDTHPVLERDLAHRAGLGWFGKNSMLINRKNGSFFIIGSLLFNQEIDDLNQPFFEVDHCGQCTRCIDACPTEAIDPETRTIIAKDCISTFTIEQFKLDTVPSEKMNLKDGFIFGCDICQDVCPWNQRVDRLNIAAKNEKFQKKQISIINFFLKREPLEISNQIENMTEGEFKRLFKGSSFERSGRRGILKNFHFFLKSQ